MVQEYQKLEHIMQFWDVLTMWTYFLLEFWSSLHLTAVDFVVAELHQSLCQRS